MFHVKRSTARHRRAVAGRRAAGDSSVSRETRSAVCLGRAGGHERGRSRDGRRGEPIAMRRSRPARRMPAAPDVAGALDLLAQPEAPTSVHDRAASTSTSPTRWPALEVDEMRAARADRRPRRGRRAAGPRARRGASGRARRARRGGSAQVRVPALGRRRDGARRTPRSCGRAPRSGATGSGAATSSAPARSRRCRCCASTPRRCCATGGVLVAWKGAVDGAPRPPTPLRRPRTSVWPPNRCARSCRIPGSERRTLHVLRKVAPTPAEVPTPARNCDETATVCEKSALRARQQRRNRRLSGQIRRARR